MNLQKLVDSGFQPNLAAAGEWASKQDRQRQRKEAVTMTDPQAVVKSAPAKAARIYADCKAQVQDVKDSPMVPPAGKSWRSGELVIPDHSGDVIHA